MYDDQDNILTIDITNNNFFIIILLLELKY